MAELPSGFDWADGLDDNLGTATPDDAILVQSANGATTVDDIQVEELPGYPVIERAEQATITHKFRMSYTEALMRIESLGRGTLQLDSENRLTKILSSQVEREKGGTAILTVVAEGMSFDNPPDQFQIVPVELGINIIKHPRYFYAFLGDGYGSTTELINQTVIRLLQDYFENTTAAYRDALTRLLKRSLGNNGSVLTTKPWYIDTITPPTFTTDGTSSVAYIPGTDMAKRAAMEIIQKYWRGEETPYVVGYQITWSAFYFRPQYLNPGGFIEDPMYEAVPQLPEYFFSPSFPPNPATTIFDVMGEWNPQCYSESGNRYGNVVISWLRKADQIEYERTWFKVIRTWIGSPVGFWDTELYSRYERPSDPNDYLWLDSDDG